MQYIYAYIRTRDYACISNHVHQRRYIDDTSTAINARNIAEAIAREIELFRYERLDGLMNARVAGKNAGC